MWKKDKTPYWKIIKYEHKEFNSWDEFAADFKKTIKEVSQANRLLKEKEFKKKCKKLIGEKYETIY